MTLSSIQLYNMAHEVRQCVTIHEEHGGTYATKIRTRTVKQLCDGVIMLTRKLDELQAKGAAA